MFSSWRERKFFLKNLILKNYPLARSPTGATGSSKKLLSSYLRSTSQIIIISLSVPVDCSYIIFVLNW